MVRTLIKLFVTSFYKANTGFFLFFFFIFFGAVNGGTLISYHASLLKSILGSWVILGGVFFFWVLYAVKCVLFMLRIVNSEEGTFVYNLQALAAKKQLLIYVILQTALYAPVLAYSIVATGYGFIHQHKAAAVSIILFQLLVISGATALIYQRMNDWLKPKRIVSFGSNLPKPFVLYPLYHLLNRYKMVMLVLKVFSVILLYIVLILNKGKSDNDSFLLFYLLILLAHFIIPFLCVQFFENDLRFFRNLLVQKWQYAAAYLLCYSLLLLPELAYLFLYGRSLIPPSQIFSYYAVSVATLFLLTGVQYSEAMDRDEYMKVGFAIFFVSIFALHIEAFFVWTMIQFAVGFILFWSGFFTYEAVE